MPNYRTVTISGKPMTNAASPATTTVTQSCGRDIRLMMLPLNFGPVLAWSLASSRRLGIIRAGSTRHPIADYSVTVRDFSSVALTTSGIPDVDDPGLNSRHDGHMAASSP
jgi:hypothetical protein